MRFHIKLVCRELSNVDRKKQSTKEIVSPSLGAPFLRAGSMPYLRLQEGPSIAVDIKEFQYAYKCGHCGHEWSEKKIKEKTEIWQRRSRIDETPIEFFTHYGWL